MVPLLLPEHTVLLPLTVPPADAGVTVMVAAPEFTVVHPVITARYWVDCVRLLYDCEVVVFTISVQLPPPSVLNCHLVMVPAWPLSVTVPLLVPVHTVVLPLTLPPVAVALIVMVAAAELAGVQVPLCTTALYWVVWVRLLYDCDVVVLLMVDQLPPPSVDISQRTTFPVWPLKFIVPLLLPEQTEVVPLTDPPTEPLVTVMVALPELTVVQPVITAWYMVVWVKLL